MSVALITALTALAYADAKAYRALWPWIALVVTSVMLLFWFWSWGAASRTSYDKPGTQNPMMNAVTASFIWLTFMTYMGFLYALPRIIETGP